MSEVVDYDALPVMTGSGGNAGGMTGTGPDLGGTTGSPGGTTGSQGGFTGNQGGSTGSQGGFTGNQGGSTGSQGGFTGSQGGSTGNRDAGAPDSGSGGRGVIDAGATDGGAVTFTQLYTTMFNNPAYASNCAGAPCHSPGTQKGLDFSTQAKGYTTALAKLKVGVAASSKIYTVLMSGSMPQARPKISAADLAKVAAWINAGALNN